MANDTYVSNREVICEGFHAPLERESAVKHWLRTECAATYDAHKADPTKALPINEAWKRLETHMDEIDREED